jgi:SET family sugar efflux transporter-like MFS transporter
VAAPALTQADASDAAWWRSLVPLGLVTTLVGLTGSFIVPFLPLFLSQIIHASPAQSALFLFLTPVAGVGVSTVVGRISDRPGARLWVLLVAASAGVVGYGSYAILHVYWGLLAVSLTLVAVASAIMPQVYAFGREVVQRTDPSRVTMGTNTLRMTMSLAWAAGAPLGAFVIGLINFSGLFIATALMHAVILAVVYLLRSNGLEPESTGRTATSTVVHAHPVAAIQGMPPSRLQLVGTMVAFTLLQTVTTLTVTTMPLFVSVTLHGPLTRAGMVLGLCAAIEIPLMLIFAAMAARFSLQRLVLAGSVFGTAYCVATSLATSVWQVAAAQLLHACFVCTIGGLGISYFQELMPTALGRATTLFSNAGRVSGMLSGLAFGLVQVHGYRLAYVMALGLSIAGTGVLALTQRRRRAPVAVQI